MDLVVVDRQLAVAIQWKVADLALEKRYEQLAVTGHQTRLAISVTQAHDYAVGLTLLLFTMVRAFRGHFTPEEHRGVEVPGIYWHFVDVMWIVVYSTVYLL